MVIQVWFSGRDTVINGEFDWELPKTFRQLQKFLVASGVFYPE